MRKDLTDITVVMDRSGSMQRTREDAEGGVNEFVRKQAGETGEAVFTLVQFDTVYEFVHRAVPIKDVPRIKLVPRGSTALLDAVGRAIVETGERLKAVPEDQRPGLVVFLIVTDGEENSSVEYTKDRLAAMVKEQTDVYKWQFTYLGANQDAFANAEAIGIPKDAAMNFAEEKTSGGYAAAHANVTRMRTASVTGGQVKNSYTEDERKAVQ